MIKKILTVTLNPAVDRVYLLDNLKIGEVNRPINVTVSAGGKGINVARIAKTLGDNVTATGFIGGYNGQFISNEVEKLGITQQFITIEGETRVNVNLTDVVTKSSTELLGSGAKISTEKSDEFISLYSKLVLDSNIVVLSGSLPPNLPLNYYKILIEIANKNNQIVILDTSGLPFKLAVDSKPYCIKPNQSEVANYLCKDTISTSDMSEALKFFHKIGISLPLISLGADGCLALIDNEIVHFSSPKVKVVNAVGSGDSFIGGVAVGLNHSLGHTKAIELGIACGASNAQFEQTGKINPNLISLLSSRKSPT